MTEDVDNIVVATRQKVQSVRNQFHRERVFGGVTDETHRELATVALQYRDVLAEFADEAAVRDRWEESGVDRLEDLVDETRTQHVEAPGRTSNTETVEKPAVLTVEPRAIYQATKELDTLAKQLGFTAETRDVTPHHDMQSMITIDDDGNIQLDK